MQAWQLWFISWTKFRIRKLIGESLWGVSKENVEVKAQNIHRIIYIVYYIVYYTSYNHSWKKAGSQDPGSFDFFGQN